MVVAWGVETIQEFLAEIPGWKQNFAVAAGVEQIVAAADTRLVDAADVDTGSVVVAAAAVHIEDEEEAVEEEVVVAVADHSATADEEQNWIDHYGFYTGHHESALDDRNLFPGHNLCHDESRDPESYRDLGCFDHLAREAPAAESDIRLRICIGERVPIGAYLFSASFILTHAFSSHVSIQYTHEITTYISNRSTIDSREFFNGKDGILLREHANFALDLFVHFILRTEPIPY